MRRLAVFAAGFGAAALLCCYAVPLTWLVGAGLLSILGAVVTRLVLRERGRRAVLVLVGLGVGFLWFRGWTALRLAPVEDLAGTTASVRATVTDFPTATGYGERVEVQLSGIPALLYTEEDGAELVPGDELTVIANLKRADIRKEEQTTVFTSRGYFLLAYAKGPLEVRHPTHTPILLLPRHWARALCERIPEVFPTDVAGLTAAVLLGDKSLLPQATTNALSRSGLSHATAVSGLHIGFLAQLLMLLCRRRQRLAAGLIIPALILFALATGAHPGTVRAVVVQIMLLTAPLLNRENDSFTTLGLALLVLLAWNPYAAASTGLQLSFASVAGIKLLTSPILRAFRPLWRRFPDPVEGPPNPTGERIRSVCTVPSASLAATLSTAPLSAIYFGSISLAGVLANLLGLWAVSGLFAFSLPAALAGLLSPTLGRILGLPARLFARWVLWVAKHLGRLDFAALPMSVPYYRLWLEIVLVMVVGSTVSGRRRPGFQLLPFLGSAAVLLLAAVGLTRLDYTNCALSLTALDVGQGACTAFLSDWRAVLVDCGGNLLQNAGDTAADWFQSLGVSRLDLLVLTHFDNDHFNGVQELFERMDIDAVAIPRLEEDPTGRRAELYTWAEAEGADITAVSALTQVELGEATFTLYPPQGQGSSNEAGVLVLCSLGDFDALITGDADVTVEAALTERYTLPDLEVLVVGHHGSKHSTSETLLRATAPDIALISTGENSYGHPDPTVLARLEAAGAQVFRTDLQGMVTVTVKQR